MSTFPGWKLAIIIAVTGLLLYPTLSNILFAAMQRHAIRDHPGAISRLVWHLESWAEDIAILNPRQNVHSLLVATKVSNQFITNFNNNSAGQYRCNIVNYVTFFPILRNVLSCTSLGVFGSIKDHKYFGALDFDSGRMSAVLCPNVDSKRNMLFVQIRQREWGHSALGQTFHLGLEPHVWPLFVSELLLRSFESRVRSFGSTFGSSSSSLRKTKRKTLTISRPMVPIATLHS